MAFTLSAQSLVTDKVIILNDSIKAMGLTQGRPQTIIASPGAGKTILIQSIDMKYVVNKRLYSPNFSNVEYLIGYSDGAYFQEIARFNMSDLNKNGNTTYYYNLTIPNKLWENTATDNYGVVVKMSHPMNFEGDGSNRMVLYVTYRVLN